METGIVIKSELGQHVHCKSCPLTTT